MQSSNSESYQEMLVFQKKATTKLMCQLLQLHVLLPASTVQALLTAMSVVPAISLTQVINAKTVYLTASTVPQELSVSTAIPLTSWEVINSVILLVLLFSTQIARPIHAKLVLLTAPLALLQPTVSAAIPFTSLGLINFAIVTALLFSTLTI